MTTIAYIHGFNSAPETDTYKSLKSGMPDYNFVSLEYDYINPINAWSDFDTQIMEIFRKFGTDVLFVGTSLGGFWADKLAQYFRTSCVIINPSIDPSESMKSYIGKNKNYLTNEIKILTEENCNNYLLFNSFYTTSPHRVVVLGMKDEILDPIKTELHFKDNAEIIKIENMGHRMENTDLLINIITSTLDNITDEKL